MSTELKVTSIERYHLCDDTSQNPNVISCELTVSGDVNVDIATSALREIADRHPMTFARLKKRGRKHVWVLGSSSLNELCWQQINPADSVAEWRTIQPDKGIPTRCLMRRDGELTHLSFRTHHAAMDGLGGLQIVNDWLLTYHRISCGTNKPRSRETSPEILPHRNDLRLLNRRFLARLWIQPIAMFGAIKFLMRTVRPVTGGVTGAGTSSGSVESTSTSAATSPSDFQLLQATLSAEVVEKMKTRAASAKATVNELILRSVFLSLHQFRKQHGLYRSGEWLRLLVPISIRDFADRRLPAANRATIVQLDRRDRDFRDPSGMMWGLNYELGCVKRWNLEKTFLLVMRCASVIPGFIARSCKKDVCRATSVVTNLGAPFERSKLSRIDGKLAAGNLIVENINLVVPLRKQTPIGFAVLRYNDQQHICMHFDPIQIERQHAEEILRMVRGNLEQDAD